jgi:hypothetical protein
MVETEKEFGGADAAGEGGDREFFCRRHGGVKDARRKDIPASGKRGWGAED